MALKGITQCWCRCCPALHFGLIHAMTSKLTPLMRILCPKSLIAGEQGCAWLSHQRILERDEQLVFLSPQGPRRLVNESANAFVDGITPPVRKRFVKVRASC